MKKPFRIRRNCQRSSVGRTRRPVFETLELRQLLSTTWDVTNGGDTGLPSQLRYVVTKDAQPGDIIDINVSNVTLTQGPITLAESLTIQNGIGTQASQATISGGGQLIFHQSAGAVYLVGLTLEDSTGSLYNAFGGTTDFSNCVVTGGLDGILVYGGDTLQLDTGTVITGNEYYGVIVETGNTITIPATTGPQVVFSHNYAGVYDEGEKDGLNMNINDTVFAYNSDYGFETYEGGATLVNCTFIGNAGDVNDLDYGGTESVSVSNSTFEDGTGKYSALNVELDGTSTFSGTQLRIENNTAQTTSLIYANSGASVTLANSVIASNAITGYSNLVELDYATSATLSNDWVGNNTLQTTNAVNWIGQASDTLLVDASSFTNNTISGKGQVGGSGTLALDSAATTASATVNNATFYGNSNVYGSGGAMYINTVAGGISTAVYNSTFYYNTATQYGGAGGIYAVGSVPVTIDNTIVAASVIGGYLGADLAGPGSFTGGYDLVQTSTVTGLTNTITGVFPGITVLGTDVNQPQGWFSQAPNMPIIQGGNVQGAGSEANIPGVYTVYSGDGLPRDQDIGADEFVVPAGSPTPPQPTTKKGTNPTIPVLPVHTTSATANTGAPVTLSSAHLSKAARAKLALAEARRLRLARRSHQLLSTTRGQVVKPTSLQKMLDRPTVHYHTADQ